MKRITTIIAILLTIISIGCKSETPIDDLPLVTQKVPENNVEVVIDAEVEEDDTFQVFYTEDGSLNFGDKNVRTTIQGSDDEQQVIFTLPDSSKPNNLRIDIGENLAQKQIKINKITVKYYGKKTVINGSDLLKYFRYNEFVDINIANRTITYKQVPGKEYDPMLYPEPLLTTVLTKLVQ